MRSSSLLCSMIVVLVVLTSVASTKKHGHRSTTPSEHDDSGGYNEVCKSLASAFTSSDVLLTGILDNNLYLLTSKLLYQIPASQMNGSMIVMKDVQGTSPSFINKTKYQMVALKKPQSFTFTFEANDLLAFEKHSNGSIIQTLAVSPDSSNITNLQLHLDEILLPNQHVFLSSSDSKTLYLLNNAPFGMNLYLLMSKFDLKTGGKFVKTAVALLCDANSSHTSIVFKSFDSSILNNCDQQFFHTWEMSTMHGFVDGLNFYLFNSAQVYMFSFEAFQNIGKSTNLKSIAYSEFLFCPKPPTTTIETSEYEETTKASGGSQILIIIAAIFVLIVIICAAGAVWYFFFSKSSDNSSSGASKGSKKSTKQNNANDNQDDGGGPSAIQAGGSNAGQGKSSADKSSPGGKNMAGGSSKATGMDKSGSSNAASRSGASKPNKRGSFSVSPSKRTGKMKRRTAKGKRRGTAGGSSSTRTATSSSKQGKTSGKSRKGKTRKGKSSSRKVSSSSQQTSAFQWQ